MTYQTPIMLNLGKSKTGLTLQGQLFNPSTNDDVGSRVTTGFLERSQGRYVWNADLPDNQDIGVAIYDSADPDVELASTVVTAEEVYDLLAIKAKTDALNVNTTVTVATPIDPVTGDVTIVRGDAYVLTGSKGALVWTTTDGAWLPYVGKTSVFTARHYKDSSGANRDNAVTPISKAASVAVVSGDTVSITVELDSADTKDIADKYVGEADKGSWFFDVQSTISTGEDDTPLSGQLTILMDVSPSSA